MSRTVRGSIINMINCSPLFSETDGCGGLKLKPDVFANENDPAEALPNCSGWLNAKPVLAELSALTAAAAAAADDDGEPNVNGATAHVAGGLKLKPTT